MSGGSYEFAYREVEKFAERLDAADTMTPARVAFASHLWHVAEAMRAIEWVDSADWGPGAEDESIRKVFDLVPLNPAAPVDPATKRCDFDAWHGQESCEFVVPVPSCAAWWPGEFGEFECCTALFPTEASLARCAAPNKASQ